MFRQDFQKTYEMVHPDERNEVIRKINAFEMVSETSTGKRQHWWIGKHNPTNEIPQNIYLLGKGTIQELHGKYVRTYGAMEWKEFINYTRELIKQTIMK
jgi:hypothetical protein